MRFLVDECTGPEVALTLRAAGHDVLSAWHDLRGYDDGRLLQIAVRENRVLITNDKDFGERVFRDQEPHAGIVLLRLIPNAIADRVKRTLDVLSQFGEGLEGAFTVATNDSIRQRSR